MDAWNNRSDDACGADAAYAVLTHVQINMYAHALSGYS